MACFFMLQWLEGTRVNSCSPDREQRRNAMLPIGRRVLGPDAADGGEKSADAFFSLWRCKARDP